MMTTKAETELNRVKNLSAFNVQGACRRLRVNQYSNRYYFDDSSMLAINPASGLGVAYAVAPGCKAEIKREKLKINI